MRVACIVPTFNGKKEFLRLYETLKFQNAKFDLVVIDSSSTDGTHEEAKKYADIFFSIEQKDFNHGGTRQWVINKLPNYDFYIYLTQDIILDNSDSITKILAPFSDEIVAAVCGRQIPHENATIFAAHARAFSYPTKLESKSKSDIPKFGLKTTFLSNSFAAYRSKSLTAVGGFPDNIIFAEDMFVAAKLILAGGKIVYAADAICRHSHNYTIVGEFRRYFDMGVFHARERWISDNFGSAGSEGLKYQISELKYLGIKKINLWPISIFRNGIKYLGYKIGKRANFLPIFIKKTLGMHKGYWQRNG